MSLRLLKILKCLLGRSVGRDDVFKVCNNEHWDHDEIFDFPGEFSSSGLKNRQESEVTTTVPGPESWVTQLLGHSLPVGTVKYEFPMTNDQADFNSRFSN